MTDMALCAMLEPSENGAMFPAFDWLATTAPTGHVTHVSLSDYSSTDGEVFSVHNETDMLLGYADNDTVQFALPPGGGHQNQGLEDMKRYLVGVVNPVLCALGILGNILNMVVLTRRRIQVALDCSMERAAHLGLIALAVSDLLYCVTSLSRAFLPGQDTLFKGRSVGLFIQMYSRPLQNIFMNTSTWLTVIMAAGRYAAICRPLHARYLVDVRATRVAVIGTFIVWTLLQLPCFWTYRLESISCPRDTYYILDHGYLMTHPRLHVTFTYIWFICGYAVPVLILAYCNVHLITALRESQRVRRLYRVSPKPANQGSQITPTLVAIVCMFLLLVSPSEILQFCYYYVPKRDVEYFLAAIVIANFLHTANFACNFALYCVVNVHFRKTWKGLLYCVVKRRYTTMQRRNTATSHSNASTKSIMFVSTTPHEAVV